MKSPVQREEALTLKLQGWCQGDCVVGAQQFVYAFDPKFRITDASEKVDDEEPAPYVGEDVEGLVILTQTCDIVRPVRARPFIEVAPLVKRETPDLNQIAKGMRPQFAIVPGVFDRGLVADLDRTMTLEKPILDSWEKVNGCRDDNEKRRFANALSRKRVRAAFPNDFVDLIKPLQERCKKKYGNDSPLGRTLEALSEIRVQPHPNWEGDQPKQVKFLFLLPPNFDSAKRPEADKEVKSLIELIPASKKYQIDYTTGFHSEMSAAEYIASDLLDLDYLSE